MYAEEFNFSEKIFILTNHYHCIFKSSARRCFYTKLRLSYANINNNYYYLVRIILGSTSENSSGTLANDS